MSKYQRNPYDYLHPVRARDLFVGRATATKDIEYYLSELRESEWATHLAIVGPRASGKTSLLNYVADTATARGFLPVRLDLSERDATSHLAFFCKLFDAIVTTACSAGAYDGVTAGTYLVFRDMVDAYEVPDSKAFCPLMFPMQFAAAMKRGHTTINVSDASIRIDLNELRREIGAPIIILCDEANVLTCRRFAHWPLIRCGGCAIS